MGSKEIVVYTFKNPTIVSATCSKERDLKDVVALTVAEQLKHGPVYSVKFKDTIIDYLVDILDPNDVDNVEAIFDEISGKVWAALSTDVGVALSGPGNKFYDNEIFIGDVFTRLLLYSNQQES